MTAPMPSSHGQRAVRLSCGLLLPLVLQVGASDLVAHEGPGASRRLALTGAQQQAIVDKHNALRGDVNQPCTAGDMETMQWDGSLASAAQTWVDMCQLGSDPNNDPSWGDNTEYIWKGTSSTISDSDLTGAIQSWYDNHAVGQWSTDWTTVSSSDLGFQEFLTIVHASANKIGCAAKICPQGTVHSQGAVLVFACKYTDRVVYQGMVGAAHTWTAPWQPGASCAACSGSCSSDTLCDAGWQRSGCADQLGTEFSSCCGGFTDCNGLISGGYSSWCTQYNTNPQYAWCDLTCGVCSPPPMLGSGYCGQSATGVVPTPVPPTPAPPTPAPTPAPTRAPTPAPTPLPPGATPAPPAPPTGGSPSPALSGGYGLTADQQQQVLDKHNDLRAGVTAPCTAADMETLVWDDTLAQESYEWAQNCLWQHDPVNGANDWGENLAYTYSSAGNSITDFKLTNSVQLWYNEVLDTDWTADGTGAESKMYTDPATQCQGHKTGTDKCMIGHYTQVVWAKTNRVGCAAVVCDSGLMGDGGFYMVCKYNPAGNMAKSSGALSAPWTVGASCAACPNNCINGKTCDPGFSVQSCEDKLGTVFGSVSGFTSCADLIAGVPSYCGMGYDHCDKTCGICSVPEKLGLGYCGQSAGGLNFGNGDDGSGAQANTGVLVGALIVLLCVGGCCCGYMRFRRMTRGAPNKEQACDEENAPQADEESAPQADEREKAPGSKDSAASTDVAADASVKDEEVLAQVDEARPEAEHATPPPADDAETGSPAVDAEAAAPPPGPHAASPGQAQAQNNQRFQPEIVSM